MSDTQQVTVIKKTIKVDIRSVALACIASAAMGAYLAQTPASTAITPASAQSPATTVVVQQGN